MRISVPAIEPREYQIPAFKYWNGLTGPGRSVDVWARRCGKDLTYAGIALMLSFKRTGLYLHLLPEFAQARRTLWDGYLNDGRRFIDAIFPRELRASTLEQEMRIEFHNGSTWQLGGSDQYNRWMGANPVFLTFSEYATANPTAWDYMRPMVRANGGHAAFISTPRGYNHLHEQLQLARDSETWRHSVITAVDAGIMTQADIDDEVRQGMPEELARQEYLCDFSSASVGSILGRQVEAAEHEGRIVASGLHAPDGAPIVVSCDIGFRDAAAFWFWQPVLGGFHLVDYLSDTGLDAEQWIARIKARPWTIADIYLPHDARARTFASRHTVQERFASAFQGKTRVRVTPAMRVADKINAARFVLPRCQFDGTACADGLAALRAWHFSWLQDRRTFSSEPAHDWASHGADAFCYGAAALRDYVVPAPDPEQRPALGAHRAFSLNQLTSRRRGEWRIP